MVECGYPEDPLQGVDEVEPNLKRLKEYFATGATRSGEWRKQQIRNFIRGIKELEDEFIEAYAQDTGRDKVLFKLYERDFNIVEAELCISQIDKWMAPESVNVEVIMAPATS
jgi:aldehyde dehydrogenase (NAD+)